MKLPSAAPILLGALLSQAAGADPFWSHWSDGKAELSGYRLVQPRYGQLRRGSVVLIYVTEPYSRKEHVKVDRQDPANADQASVLKLNVVRDFQTGIYDYNTLTSIFADPADGFRPLEVSFSMQEWCGHVYEESLFARDAVEMTTTSYFQGESRRERVPLSPKAISEDALLVRLRSLSRAELDTAALDVQLLPGATFRRLHHQPPELAASRIAWSSSPREVSVPAGKFQVLEASYGRVDGSSCAIQVETAYPHRIVGWSCSDGERAELLGSTRLPYWQLNTEGAEKHLAELGLPVRD